MIEYKIKIFYQTGDSFHTEEKEEFFEFEWNNLDKAKESLLRIKNYTDFYEENSDNYHKPKGKLPIGIIWDDEYKMLSLELVDDNGNPFRTSSFWTGYFETLYSAEIIINDKTMKYVFN